EHFGAGFQPNSRPLLRLVFERIDEASLDFMAGKDYGHYHDDHLKALAEILEGFVPEKLEWVPREVLELTRNFDQDSEAGYWRRLFACTSLLQSDDSMPEHTILVMTKMAIALGKDVMVATRQFLGWCLCQQPRMDDYVPHLAVAMIILSVDLNDLIPDMVDYLICRVQSHPGVWGLFGQGWGKEWKAIVREKLIDPVSLDGKIRHFGTCVLIKIR
ncbi:MAG: hypothetical protein ACKOGA_10255, partial [Planctomycetaceae bacterium]